MYLMKMRIYELERDILYLGTYVHNKDSDQPANPRSSIRIFAWRSCIAKDLQFYNVHADSDDPNQADLSFAECTSMRVHFLT